MAKVVPKQDLIATLKTASDVFKSCAKKSKILAALAWKPEVMAEFFQKKESDVVQRGIFC